MMMNLNSAAKLLQVSEDQVSRWVQTEGLPAQSIQDRYQFDRIELLEWAWRKKRPICPSVATGNGSEWTPMLASALELGGIHYHLPGNDKGSVYRALLDALPLPEAIDREHLWQVLMAREALCPTGMGDGIAIPHPRNPVVLHVDLPVFAIGFPETPIKDFGAFDDRPVRTLLLIISPAVRFHLRILAALTSALHSPEVVGCLDQRVGPEELFATVVRVVRSSSAARMVSPPRANDR